jgi:hypothetical protein
MSARFAYFERTDFYKGEKKMVKKTTAPAVAPVAEPNKAEAIRAYASANPAAKPAEIAKALAAQGIKVSSGRVATVLSKSKPQIDVDAVKAASAFVKATGGKAETARKAIELAGGFVEQCGSKAKALAAIETLESLADIVG